MVSSDCTFFSPRPCGFAIFMNIGCLLLLSHGTYKSKTIFILGLIYTRISTASDLNSEHFRNSQILFSRSPTRDTLQITKKNFQHPAGGGGGSNPNPSESFCIDSLLDTLEKDPES
jgi:hypothetical protein